MEIAWRCSQFCTPVSNGVAEIAEFNHLKGCPHAFGFSACLKVDGCASQEVDGTLIVEDGLMVMAAVE